MVARQLRRLLMGELLIYGLLSAGLVLQAAWTPFAAMGFALMLFLGLRLLVVAVSFGFMLVGSDVVPEESRIGLAGALRIALEEYLGLVLFFTAIQPFESFWMGPDRLPRSTGARPPLLLVHGYQCNRGFWFWLRPRLEAAGVCVDLQLARQLCLSAVRRFNAGGRRQLCHRRRRAHRHGLFAGGTGKVAGSTGVAIAMKQTRGTL